MSPLTPVPDFLDVYTASRRLALGVPHQVEIAAHGNSVLFLRTRTATDPLTCLWRTDGGGAQLTVVADPAELSDQPHLLPAEDRVLQRRTRSVATGITSYSSTDDQELVVFTVAGRLYALHPGDGSARRLPVSGGVHGVSLSPSGHRIGYLRAGGLLVSDLDGTETELAAGEPDVTWGMAELIAAEELGRTRGFWWLPDGERLLVARVDESAVDRWWFTDLAVPDTPPTAVRYPAAGRPNARVSLHVLGLDGHRTPIDWPSEELPYLLRVSVVDGQPLAIGQSRDQRRIAALTIDPDTGRTALRYEERAAHGLSVSGGAVAALAGGTLVRLVEDGDTRRLQVGTRLFSPPDQQLRDLVVVHDEVVVYTAWTTPREVHVWRWTEAAGAQPLTEAAGVHAASASAGGLVIRSDLLDQSRPQISTVPWDGAGFALPVVGADLPVEPEPDFQRLTVRELETALLLPSGPGVATSLPVLLDPYGGPGSQRVTASRRSYALSQWFADQGFAVLVIDGRGTPGRGLGWEHAVDGDLATTTVADQVDGLLAAAAANPRLDLSRVGYRGWSFGGFLGLQLALRHGDLIRAAVCGAAVVDWRGYDTHYTERFLGDPNASADPYDRSSVPDLAVPADPPALLLVHGLVDDNVHPSHTVGLSARLRRQGWPHDVLYLPEAHHGVTEPAQLRSLLAAEVAFLQRHLHGSPGAGATR